MRAPTWHLNYTVDAETGCWEWAGYRDKAGYGRAKTRKRHQSDLAHRAIYERQAGPIPVGYELHHKCENKGCVNPAHLVPLTRRQHVQDHSPHTKLTREQAGEISHTMHELCEKYGVRPRTLAAIAEGRIWND